MGSEGPQFHVLFFPLMAHGHMIPTADIARLFAARGAKVTVATTPVNAPVFTRVIDKSKADIAVEVYKFPSEEAGLPDGVENIEYVDSMEMTAKFFKAIALLEQTMEQLLIELRPDCLVADMFFPYATDVAAKFNIPRLVFHGSNFFSFCISDYMKLHQPHQSVSSDDEVFVLAGFPGEVKLTRAQLQDNITQKEENELSRMIDRCIEAEEKSYGIIVNSFHELESDYVDYYRNVMGRRAWPIGPASLCNKSTEEKARRGKEAVLGEHECLKWLDSKKPNSVIYVCFGTMTQLSAAQLREIAAALEASGQEFIWVIRGSKDEKDWLPEGFEMRVEGRGLIVRGWAPQVLILDHEATGGFLTHCGWNSALEAIAAGVSMVTLPVFAEQFSNEKLITQVLKTGVAVGVKKWSPVPVEVDVVGKDEIEKALRRIMVGEEAEEIRERAKELKEEAWKAVEEGGSSYCELNALIQELRNHKKSLEG